jgi:hypothetical protein
MKLGFSSVRELNPFTHATELIRFALYEQVAWVSSAVVVGRTVVSSRRALFCGYFKSRKRA